MTEVPNRAAWINLAVGILAIITPFAVADTSAASRVSIVITGIIIGVVAIIELSVTNRPHATASYWPVINLLAGIWLLISTSLAAGYAAVTWSDVSLGVVAIVTAIVSLSYERMHAMHPSSPSRG